ncbi:peroxide stress protein YaaA [uncultured Weeksella sp.]|uniref:peroxide stress protein YaaA n=1 Tax=uncultured Weeksella sp. TaxID=1161389 RepID=UPI00259BC6EC|nr:peroxide stress protein YaaA [uncultured Weeksella sp.]
MKILISPAKLMDINPKSVWKKSTHPQFLETSEKIMQELRNKNVQELQNLMKISTNLAEVNVERNLVWTAQPNDKQTTQAITAFAGEVYRGIKPEELSTEGQKYLDKNLFILSGLYGLLRPSDQIMLYRLEMGTKLPVEKSKDLYEIWRAQLTEYVNNHTQKDETIINLASNEYVKALDKKKLNSPLIEIDFMDFKDGKLKKIMMYFKHARGEMVRWCAEHQCKEIEELKNFDGMGYQFDANLSTDKRLVYTR